MIYRCSYSYLLY